jgi:hypothetical protein
MPEEASDRPDQSGSDASCVQRGTSDGGFVGCECEVREELGGG